MAVPHSQRTDDEPGGFAMTLGMIISHLGDLADQIRHLDRKTDTRFNGLDRKLDAVADDLDTRLTPLERDHEISEVIGERQIRASDKRRHLIMGGVGVAATLAGGGISVLIEKALGG